MSSESSTNTSNTTTVKTVQTLLAPLLKANNDQDNDQSSKEKPAKIIKRNFSEVSEESIEGVELITIHQDLKEIKESLQGNVKKSDLDCLVKQKDLQGIVTSIVSQLLKNFEDQLKSNLDTQLREATEKIRDKMDSLLIENEELRERIRAKDRVIETLQDQVNDNSLRSTEALKLANYNEQYSRKHNIRIMNYPEKKGEVLRTDFLNLIKTDLKLELDSSDVIAIHRIPGKEGMIRPIIAKVRNTDLKINIMRNKKLLSNNVKFHDDVTQRNLGLMKRLKNTELFDNVWFYNCNIYAKQKDGPRIKFDLFDNAEERLKALKNRKKSK